LKLLAKGGVGFGGVGFPFKPAAKLDKIDGS